MTGSRNGSRHRALRQEIAAVESELLAGNPDLQGLLLALSDWHAELRILQSGSGGRHAEGSTKASTIGGRDAAAV